MEKECCEACGGNGKINGETCKYCKGVGWFDEKPVEVIDDFEPGLGCNCMYCTWDED